MNDNLHRQNNQSEYINASNALNTQQPHFQSSAPTSQNPATDNLVPLTQETVLDSVMKIVNDEGMARTLLHKPSLAGSVVATMQERQHEYDDTTGHSDQSQAQQSQTNQSGTSLKVDTVSHHHVHDVDCTQTSNHDVVDPKSVITSVAHNSGEQLRGANSSMNVSEVETVATDDTNQETSPVRTVFTQEQLQPTSDDNATAAAHSSTPMFSAENAGEAQSDSVAPIPIKAVDAIGRATAEDVREAMHQVIDPELGIDVVDLGLVYGIEIDELGRAIITMTLTTPACPLTDLLEDETASVLAGLVEEFRIDWVWSPPWTMSRISPEGRDQLNAIGYNFNF